MGTENQPIDSLERHLMEINRNIRQQQRRRSVTSAADILGPGFGPTATLVLDWNADEPTFNGFFHSNAGDVLNSPDNTISWFGVSIAADDNLSGVQVLWSADDADPRPRELRRRWKDDGSGVTRTYSEWLGGIGWTITGITPVGGAAVTTQAWRISGDVVSISVGVQPGADISVPTNGNVVNTPMLQVPPQIVPSASPTPNQGLGSGALGRMTQWVISPSGIISLVACAPGSDINAGADLSVSGTYLL